MGVDGKGNANIPDARSGNIPTNHCLVINGLTPSGPSTPPPGNGFWSRPIVLWHEECHVSRFYSPPFWENFMRIAETTIEGAANNVTIDHTNPSTLSATSVIAAALPTFQAIINNQHIAADLAEGPTSEQACHTQSNVRFTSLVQAIAAQKRPVTPTGLVAVAGGPTSVTLTWVDNACNETEYRVYRRKRNGKFVVISSLSANTITFTDTTAGLQTGTPYSYYVTAISPAGESNKSNIINVTTP